MPDKGSQEKTEKATPKRRKEAREKGQVARSKEISSVAVLLASLLFLYFFGQSWIVRLEAVIRRNFIYISSFNISPANFYVFFISLITDTLKILGPFFIILLAVALISNVIQGGWIFTLEPLTPNLNKLNPIKGFKNIFISKRTIIELFKNTLKIIIIGYVGYKVIKTEFFNLPSLVDASPMAIVTYGAKVSSRLFFNTAIVLIFLAILDYGYQRWEFEESLKMSKQELKDEFKQTEGNPMIKSRIRSIQRQMARKRMMSEIPKANVVITNPTHIAVALRYNPSEMKAPRVVAKGIRLIAEHIKEIASKNNIPIIEDKPLAQALYKMTEIGQEIPPDLYRAVAEILAYVYKLKGKREGVGVGGA
ncbi:MAG: flagellar biosynthesis protein FlhB [bacterium]